MSFPNIPDVSPAIDINRDDAVDLLLASIAFEELGLAHVINAEAEKIQYVLGTIEGQTRLDIAPTIEDLLEIDRSVEQTLKSVIKTQMLLQFKLEDVLDITSTSSTTTSTSTTTTSTSTTTTSTSTTTTSTSTTTTSTSTTTTSTSTTTTSTSTTTTSTSTTTTSTTSTTTTTTKYVDAGTAWSVGTSFGHGNAQYTTLASGETQKTVVLGLGRNHEDIGSVQISLVGNILSVTITTDPPYIMDEVHLYVDDTAPTNSNPGGFPYQYTVSDPNDYFTTHTFNVDVSAFAGDTIYIAAHAHVLQ